jgi:hypothetical protein
MTFSPIDKLEVNFMRVIARAGAFDGITYVRNETIPIVRRFRW